MSSLGARTHTHTDMTGRKELNELLPQTLRIRCLKSCSLRACRSSSVHFSFFCREIMREIWPEFCGKLSDQNKGSKNSENISEHFSWEFRSSKTFFVQTSFCGCHPNRTFQTRIRSVSKQRRRVLRFQDASTHNVFCRSMESTISPSLFLESEKTPKEIQHNDLFFAPLSPFKILCVCVFPSFQREKQPERKEFQELKAPKKGGFRHGILGEIFVFGVSFRP